MTALSYSKNGRKSQSRTATTSQEIMELYVSQLNSSYSRVLARQPECSGRLAIQNSQGFKRFKIEPQNTFSYCNIQRNTSNRLISFPPEPSVTKMYVLASGPRQLCSRFPSLLLEKPLRLCIPSILLNSIKTCCNTYNSRKSASIFNYQSTWQMWASWCYEWEVNPFTRNTIETLNFLAFLYEGYEYNLMNSHMSAISAYHVHTDNNPIG